MFKKQYRITKDKEYENVFKNGRSSYSKILGIKFITNDLQHNRFGIIVNNKVSKSAVKRSLIKRRLREVLQEKDQEIKQGFDIVVIALPEIIDVKFEEIKTAITFVLKRSRLAGK